jgi:beta-N-acetylhexosaminidase
VRRGLQRLTLALSLTLTMAGCTSATPTSTPHPLATASTPASAATAPGPPVPQSAAEELPWGPTAAELGAARALVRGWDAAHLAGQVIIGRYHGTDPTAGAALVRRHHLAGVCMTGGNIIGPAQVRASTSAIHAAVRADGRDIPAVIGVDQEGGTTAHLGRHAARFPAFMSAGAAVAGASARGVPDQGGRIVADAARATALELRGLGFTWVFAPVADVTIGPADPTIGTRAAADDPEIAAAATAAAIHGFRDGALVPTAKHYPGHGSVTADSHRALPVQSAGLAALKARDLVPFVAAVRAGAPAVMMSHVAVTAFDPGVPASLSAAGYASLKRDTGFDGVALTDSLGMGAVRRGGDPSVRALVAGADLLLMPADTAAAHVAVTTAISGGTVPRARAEEAAAKVVALQRWQARRAAAIPVPDDAATAAVTASRALSAAAVTRVGGPCPATPLRAVRVLGGTAQDRARFTAAARAGGLTVGSGTTVALVGSGTASADVVVALAWPTVLARSHGPAGSYALYGRTEGAFSALVAVLTGRAAAAGALPVRVAGAAARC